MLKRMGKSTAFFIHISSSLCIHPHLHPRLHQGSGFILHIGITKHPLFLRPCQLGPPWFPPCACSFPGPGEAWLSRLQSQTRPLRPVDEGQAADALGLHNLSQSLLCMVAVWAVPASSGPWLTSTRTPRPGCGRGRRRPGHTEAWGSPAATHVTVWLSEGAQPSSQRKIQVKSA